MLLRIILARVVGGISAMDSRDRAGQIGRKGSFTKMVVQFSFY